MHNHLCPVGTRIQTYLLARPAFSLVTARAWARHKGLPKIHPTPGYFRVRVASPESFRKGSFRTITLSEDGTVRAVVGCPA